MNLELPRAQPDYDMMDDLGDYAESHPEINKNIRENTNVLPSQDD